MLHELILPFYAISRATPLPRKFGRNENDAEHSWSLALMACALAPQIDPKLDVGLICQFAVVHDLVEVYAGDTPNFAPDEDKASKSEREHAALLKLEKDFKDLPWIADTIQQYEKQDSQEAIFVRSLDKTLALMQDFASEGKIYRDFKITIEQYDDKMQAHRAKAAAYDDLYEYYEAALQRIMDNPQLFHQKEE